VRAERFWLVVAVVLAALLLVAILLTLAVVAPPALEPVPLPSASSL
jgi:hypothetical protein